MKNIAFSVSREIQPVARDEDNSTARERLGKLEVPHKIMDEHYRSLVRWVLTHLEINKSRLSADAEWAGSYCRPDARTSEEVAELA